MLVLDHLFVFAEPDDTARVVAAGLSAGSGRRHSGQGTANARFFFSNAYLELIWVEDEEEARSALTAPTRLWERSRWRETGASPFGVALRRAGADDALPSKTWSYRPKYLPDGMAIEMADNSDRVSEPLIFIVPGGVPPCEYSSNRAEPLQHPAGVNEISHVAIDVSASMPHSDALQYIASVGMVDIGCALKPSMRIEFDGGESNTAVDLWESLQFKF